MSHRHRHSDYHPHHRRHSSDQRRRSYDRHDRRHSVEHERRNSSPVRRSYGSHDRRSWDAAAPIRRSFRRSFGSGAEPMEFYEAVPGIVYRETEESQRRRASLGEDGYPRRTSMQEGGYPRRTSYGTPPPVNLQVPVFPPQGVIPEVAAEDNRTPPGPVPNSGRQSISQRPPPPDQQTATMSAQSEADKPCPPCSHDDGTKSTAPECPPQEEMASQGAQVLTLKFWDKNGAGNEQEEQFLAVNLDMLPKTEIQNLLPMENGKIVMKPRGRRKTVRAVSSEEFSTPAQPPSPSYSPIPRQQEAFAETSFTPPPASYNEYQSYSEPPVHQPPPQDVRVEFCPPPPWMPPPQPDVCNNFVDNQQPPYTCNPFIPPPPQCMPPTSYQSQPPPQDEYFDYPPPNEQQCFYSRIPTQQYPPSQQLHDGQYRDRRDEYDEDNTNEWQRGAQSTDQFPLDSINDSYHHQRDNSSEQRRDKYSQEEDSTRPSLSFLPHEQTGRSASLDHLMDPRHPPQPQPFPPYYPAPPQRPWTGQPVPPPEYQTPPEPGQRSATAPPWVNGQMAPPTQLPFQQMPPPHWQAGNQACPVPPQQDHYSSQYSKPQQPGSWPPPQPEQHGYYPTPQSQRNEGRNRSQGADACCRDYNDDQRDPYWNERGPTPNPPNDYADTRGRHVRRGLGLDNDACNGNGQYRPGSPRSIPPNRDGARSNGQGRGRYRDSNGGYNNDECDDSSRVVLRINPMDGGGPRNRNCDPRRGGRGGKTLYEDDCGANQMRSRGGPGEEEDEEDHEHEGKKRKKPAIVLEIDPEVMKQINCQPTTKSRPGSRNSEGAFDESDYRRRGGSNSRGRGNVRGQTRQRDSSCEDPSKLVLVVNPMLADNNRNTDCNVGYRMAPAPLHDDPRVREPNRNRTARVQNRCDADDNGNHSMALYQRNDPRISVRRQENHKTEPRHGHPPIRIHVHSRFYERLQKDEEDYNLNEAHRDPTEYAMVPKSQVIRNTQNESHMYDDSSHDDDNANDLHQTMTLPPPERKESPPENRRVRLENLDPNLCPYCGIGVFVKKTSMTGYLTAILCFPCGLYCCLAKKCCYIVECTYCHATTERDPKKVGRKKSRNWASKDSISLSDCDNSFNDKKYTVNKKDRNKDGFR